MSERPIRVDRRCPHCEGHDLQRWDSVPDWVECCDCLAEFTLRGNRLVPETGPNTAPPESYYRRCERQQMGITD